MKINGSGDKMYTKIIRNQTGIRRQMAVNDGPKVEGETEKRRTIIIKKNRVVKMSRLGDMLLIYNKLV